MPKLNDLVPKQTTRVAILLDKSDSMRSLAKFAVDTYNEQLSALRANQKEQDVSITLIFFDSDVEVKCFNEPLSVAKNLDYDEYKPATMTAMCDAIGVAIAKFRALKDCNDENVSHLIVIITDGQENSSKEFHKKTIANNIKDLQKSGGWTFTFLGANVNVEEMAKEYNFDVGNTMSYKATADGMRYSSQATSRGIGNYLGLRSQGVRNMASFYSGEQKNDVLSNDLLTEVKDDDKLSFDIHMGNEDVWNQAVEANEKLQKLQSK